VVADNCNDKTIEIAKNIKPNCIIINEKLCDPGLARQFGLKKSSKEFIAFLDADDEFCPNKLEQQYNHMIKNNLDWTSTNYVVLHEHNGFKYFVKPRNIITYKLLLKNCDIGNSTVMIHRKLLPKYFPVRPKEDFKLWLSILKNGNCCYGLNINGTKYYRSKNQNSNSYLNNYIEKIKVFKELDFGAMYITFLLVIDFLYQIKRRITIK
jgi:glycosyltransferase involved in cell wall biosynthesis